MADKTSSTKGYGIADYALMPIAPPRGGSVGASLGSAALLGGAVALGGDYAMSRFGLNDPEEDAHGPTRRGRMLRRGAVGAGVALGLSLATNYAAHRGNWTEKRSFGISRGMAPKGMELATPSGEIGRLWKGVPPSSFPSDRKTSSWRASDAQLKRMVMQDPAIAHDTKRMLFRQIDEVTQGAGRSASIDRILHYGAGALAGYFGAVRMGAGPVSRGVATAIGAMVGGAVHHHRNPNDWSYTPGFRSY